MLLIVNEKCQALDKKIAKDQARLWKACCRAAKRRWTEWAHYPEGIKDVKRQYKYCLIELVEERTHLKRQHVTNLGSIRTRGIL